MNAMSSEKNIIKQKIIPENNWYTWTPEDLQIWFLLPRVWIYICAIRSSFHVSGIPGRHQCKQSFTAAVPLMV